MGSSREVTPWSGDGGDGSRGRLGIVASAMRTALPPLLPIDDDGSDDDDDSPEAWGEMAWGRRLQRGIEVEVAAATGRQR